MHQFPTSTSVPRIFAGIAGFALTFFVLSGCKSTPTPHRQRADTTTTEEIESVPNASRFAAAIERTRARLYADPHSRESEAAMRATEDFLSGLIESAWRMSHAARYIDAPRFASGSGIVGLPGLFNPDNLYRSALLDPDGVYRISGTRGSHARFTLQFLDAYPLVGLSKGLQVIDLDELGVKPGQRFALRIGGARSARRDGLWWPMPKSARAVLARQTFNEWEKETATTIRIDRLQASHDLPHGDGSHADLAADYLDRMTALWAEGYLAQLQKLPANAFPPIRPSGEEAGGLAGQQGVITRFELKADEALIVSVRASDAAYQSIQVGDQWFTTPNPVKLQSSLNQSQARRSEDGMLHFVISNRDPGIANWLATAGAERGYIMIRWQGIGTPLTDEDQPRAIRVAISEIEAQLPIGTVRITEEDRQAQLAGRASLPALRQ